MFPSKMMLCVDSAEEFHACKAEVGWLARRLECGLVLFHSAPVGWAEADKPAKQPSEDAARLDALVDDPALYGIEIQTQAVETDRTLVDALVEGAKAAGADLLLMPTHARSGFDRLLFDSVAERTLRSCRLPVLTLDLNRMPGQDTDLQIDQVIVPLDFSRIAERAVPRAAALAEKLKCPLTLMHAIEDFYSGTYAVAGVPAMDTLWPTLIQSADQQLEDIAAKYRASTGVEIRTSSGVGLVVDRMKEAVEPYDNPLIVMSTAGRNSIGDFILGSHAERTVRTTHCSVLSLPATFLAEDGSGKTESAGS